MGHFFIVWLSGESDAHSLAYISLESDQIFVKILSQMYPWSRKSPLNFGINPESVSGYGLGSLACSCVLKGLTLLVCVSGYL